MSLEKIIKKSNAGIRLHIDAGNSNICKDIIENWINDLAQAIRSAGYVRIEDLELDTVKAEKIIEDTQAKHGVKLIHWSWQEWENLNTSIAKALANAKDIIRVKKDG